MTTKKWTLCVNLTEDGDETSARAVLTAGERRLVGTGRAHRNPADPAVPEIGDELAAGRALADLSAAILGAAFTVDRRKR